MPVLIAVLGYIIGFLLMILGVIGIIHNRKPSNSVDVGTPSTTTRERDKLNEYLIKTKIAAQELIKLPVDGNLNSTEPSSVFTSLVLADDKYKLAIKLLRAEKPRKDLLIKTLLHGISLLDTCKRKNELSIFKSDLDNNSKSIISQIDTIIGEATQKPQVSKEGIDNIKFSAESKVYNNAAILKVTNQSDIATFHGTFRIMINQNEQLETHRLFWKGYGSEAKLGNGDTADILMANLEWMSQDMTKINLYETAASSDQNPSSFIARLPRINNGALENNEPLYLEIVIKPLSSLATENRSYYVITQPSIMKLEFRKIESIPP